MEELPYRRPQWHGPYALEHRGTFVKRFVICLDGTWQKLQPGQMTNIGVIASSVAHETKHPTKPDGPMIPQIVIYSQGVGANIDALGENTFLSFAQGEMNRLAGGVFGDGLEDGIIETYMRLAFNFEADDEIYIFGFSRGAFAARSLAGLISCSGIISRMHADQTWEAFRLYRTTPPENASQAEKDAHAEECRQFRLAKGKGRRNPDGTRLKTDDIPEITYLGIFDTVGQRGVPEAFGWIAKIFNKRYGFHNLRICANVKAARHAVAIDEHRFGFPPTLWQNLEEANQNAGRLAYEQCWFIGSHGDVGGGEGSTLSAAPLKWVAEGAAKAGLRFYGTYGSDESPLHQTLRAAGFDIEKNISNPTYDAKISRPKVWQSFSPVNLPWRRRKIWTRKKAPELKDAEGCLDITVALRTAARKVHPRYAPPPLRPFHKALREIAAGHLKPDEMYADRPRRFWIF
jgi:uncharacterized protein (DUF2235 family)